MSGVPRSIGVLGGGTSGYFAALAIKKRFPAIAVTVVESAAVPIIGVGEATTTLMPPFLHTQLGLSIHEMNRVVRPTFKMGIRFEWGLPGDYHFDYPFGDADPIVAQRYDGDLHAQSLVSLMMDENLSPILRGPDGELLSLLPQLKFAYHLDNAPFVSFLAKAAADAGIEHVEFEVAETVLRADGRSVDKLRAADGRELSFDFYVDASGFRSQLLERALGVEFESYASSLFCDRAIVAEMPQRGPIQPYTTAETMDAGWCWRIPVRGEDHRGYVHSSAFISEDRALAEMRAKNPDLREPWVVKFRSGRHRRFWAGNVVAVGNAYGFVEPLESTALHMVIVELAYLLAGLERPDQSAYAEAASQAVGAHWDYLRWFLAVHYKFNRRLDTPFWRAARAEVDVGGLAPYLERFQAEGPFLGDRGREFAVGDPAFGFSGLMMMLLGQRVPAPLPTPDTPTEAEWRERVEQNRRVLRHALPQAEALAVLDEDPAWFEQVVRNRSSWCVGEAERVHLLARELSARPR